MPLIQSASKKALSENIGKEIAAGKDPKQAAAIAYSVQRANDETENEDAVNCSGNVTLDKLNRDNKQFWGK